MAPCGNSMRMDEELLYDFMSNYRIIGDIAFGGSGTREEDILVGYIYGVLSSHPESSLERGELDYEVFSFGGYYYVIWMDEVDYDEDDEEEEPEEENAMVRLEEISEPEDELTDEDIEEFMEDIQNELFPVAVEGPLTENELREKLGDNSS